MLRHIPQPLYARGLERHVGIKPPRHGLMDDGLLLLLKQLDELLFGADIAFDALVCVPEELDDGGLLIKWGNRQ